MRPLWALALLFPLQLTAIEVRVHPGEVVYVDEADPQHGLYTAMLHNIAVVQKDAAPVTLESIEIKVLSQGQTVQTLIVPAAKIEENAKRLSAMEAQGLLKLYDFYFQTSRFLGEGIHLSPSLAMSQGTALLVNSKPLLFIGLPDQIVITAHARDAAGKPVEGRGTLRVESHRSPNQYSFPLAGTWYVGAGPSLHSHHRWVPNEEFAVDLVGMGDGGRLQKGDGSRLEDWFGYGREVLAVADGVVVETAADFTESHDRLQQPGESTPEFEKRTVEAQNVLLAKSYKAPMGNYVVLRHAGGEFSHYGHLKQGSVRVKAGDAVARGQAIAQLGHTGNSTSPHLHFQLTDGADPLYSRGLPIVFNNYVVEALGYEGRSLQSGWIVTTRK